MSKNLARTIETARDEVVESGACLSCVGYLDRRGRKIAGPMARAAAEQGRTVREVAEGYMAGVHARHKAGLPI